MLKKSKSEAYPSVVVADGSIAGEAASLVTIGFRSVPFLFFLPPLPFAAFPATLAICFPLLMTALVISTPSIVWISEDRCVRVEEGWNREDLEKEGHKVLGRRRRS